jgi:ABC-type antimicrobial peptide transport system permease subunit
MRELILAIFSHKLQILAAVLVLCIAAGALLVRDVPYRFTLRSLFRRKTSTLLTLGGLALVIMTYTALSALNAGIAAAYTASGEPDNLLVLRSGATTEGYSGISRERARLIADQPGIARGGDGTALIAPECITIFSLEKIEGGLTNIQTRGVTPASVALRRNFRLVAGRMFTPGMNELIVGAPVSRKVKGLTVGSTFNLLNRDWSVVGVFDTGATAFASEIWADAEILMPASELTQFNSVLLRTENPAAGKQLAQLIAADPRLKLDAKPEMAYYKSQTEGPGIPPIFKLAVGLCYILAFGALFGAANLLYAAIAARRREIATLRVLGFSRAAVILLFLVEGVLLCGIAGAAGIIAALPMMRLSLATTNWQTFSAINFGLYFSPRILLDATAMSVCLGGFGAFFPALNAARTKIVEGLRKN